MSRNHRPLVSAAKLALDEFKEEISNDMGIEMQMNIKGYNGDIKTAEAGALANMSNGKNIGGEMVKRMVENAEKQMTGK